MFFVIDIFWKLWFVKHFIFDQWPKLYLGFDAEHEIRILKVIK
jgi:hypothetical protein